MNQHGATRGLGVVASAVAMALAAMVVSSHAEQFIPNLQAQDPPSVGNPSTTAKPNIAIVVGHSGTMMENISTGKSDFLPADFNETIPTGIAPACAGGATSSSFGASPLLLNPAHFRLFCRDGSLTSASGGSGPLLETLKNVNLFANATGTAGDQYQAYMARIFPDINFTTSTGGTCYNAGCSEGTTTSGSSVFEYGGTTYDEGTDYNGPDKSGGPSGAGDICSRTGALCNLLTPPGTGDGVHDRSVYPWDSSQLYTLNNRFNYQPSAGSGGVPFHFLDGDFPLLDPIANFNFNFPIRQASPGAGGTSRWRNSKMRATMCAVEGFIGLGRFRAMTDGGPFNCGFDDLGDSTADDANGDTYDDFYFNNVKGVASIALYKTYQLSPGLYPPFDSSGNYTNSRLKVDFRVGSFYGPGSVQPTGGVAIGCSIAGDPGCDRSIALLGPDVNRNSATPSVSMHDCMGLARSPSPAQPASPNTTFQTPIGNDNASLSSSIDLFYGTPGGVMSLSGILRDACGSTPGSNCPGASSTLPNNVPGTGIFNTDTNNCGTSNALVIITDSPDSCADVTCTNSIGERLPGYPSTPGQPLPATSGAKLNCPDSIAAAMRASTTEAKTYIIGEDAGWDTPTKQAVSAVAAAGGTNSYYRARSFSDVENALHAIYNDLKFSGDVVVPSGVFALGIVSSDNTTGIQDVVVDARFRPATWQGYLFARKVTQAGEPLAYWEAGSLLQARDVSTAGQARSAFTTLDLNCDGKINGADELAPLLLGVGASPSYNPDLVTPGGPFATRSACTATATPRNLLKNVHNTGVPFFLDSAVDATNGLTNRDGNAKGLLLYTVGYNDPAIGAAPGVVKPALGYRTRTFLSDGSVDPSGTPKPWELYDIANSSPVIVGPALSVQANDADKDQNGLSDYEEYQAKVKGRPRVVYVGDNGGALHAFNVDGDSTIKVNNGTLSTGSVTSDTTVNTAGAKAGGEIFAIWPHEFLQRLKRYANVSYGATGGHEKPVHEDGLDLTARIFDAKIYPNTEGGPLFGWRTVLVIGARNGGHMYMALDVTDPSESMGIQDKKADGTLAAYKFPTLLWEFSEFRDDGHSAQGVPLALATDCDETPLSTERMGNAACEDNGQADNWEDRLGHSWSIPFVTRSRTSATAGPVMYVLSGPGAIEAGATPPGTAIRGAGYVLGIDVASGSLIDLDSTSTNGLPERVSDGAISSGPNAGPVPYQVTCLADTSAFCTAHPNAPNCARPSAPLGVPDQHCTAGSPVACGNISDPTNKLQVFCQAHSDSPYCSPSCSAGSTTLNLEPFRTSIVGGDITPDDDSTYGGQRADVMYWGDLGGRLWRARFTSATSNDIQTKVVFFPGADVNTVDTDHPIVSRPSLTPSKNQTTTGTSPPLLVIFGDGSLHFGVNDLVEGTSLVDEIDSKAKFRILNLVDDASTGNSQYLDFSDENNCADGTAATGSVGDPPTANTGGDLDNRTAAVNTFPSVTDPQSPPSGTHPPTQAGGYYQCLANMGGSGIPNALGSERMLGSAFTLGGAVIVETFHPVDPASLTNICYNVGTGSILTYQYNTGGLINFTLAGGATSSGGGKYYTAPTNPVAVGNGPYKPIGAPPDGFPPDFLRYHAITGGSQPVPPATMSSVYWREPF